MKKVLLSVVMLLSAFQLLVAQDCSKVFISEYVEGTGNNKAIELYNPTDAAVDLTSYKLVRYSNGGSQPYAVSLAGGTIPARGTYVVVLDKRDPTATGQDTMVSPDLAAKANVFLCAIYNTNRMMYFNGNDAVTLEHTNGDIYDIFGVVGENPGLGNGVGSDGGWNDIDTCGFISGKYWWLAWTKDHTLRRKQDVKIGTIVNPNQFNTSIQWDTLPENTFADLGHHDCQCDPNGIQTVSQPNAFFYPNPSINQYFMVKANDIISNVKIASVSGQLVFNRDNSQKRGDMEVVLNDCKSGMYFVTITFDNKAVITKKIMIE